MKTPYIAFVGCEGSGKSTQIELARKKYPGCIYTNEPGGSEYAQRDLRPAMLTSPRAKQASAFTQLCFMLGACHDTLRNIVVPALRSGNPVITDRSAQVCAYAYEVGGLEGDEEVKKLFFELRDYCASFAELDLIVYFDVSPEEGMKRVAKRYADKGIMNHFDGRGPGFHARVRKGYQEILKVLPIRSVTIDAHKSEAEVWKELQAVLDPLLS